MYTDGISVLVLCSFNVFPILERRNINLTLTYARTSLAILYSVALSRNLTPALTPLALFYYEASLLNRVLHSSAFKILQRSNAV